MNINFLINEGGFILINCKIASYLQPLSKYIAPYMNLIQIHKFATNLAEYIRIYTSDNYDKSEATKQYLEYLKAQCVKYNLSPSEICDTIDLGFFQNILRDSILNNSFLQTCEVTHAVYLQAQPLQTAVETEKVIPYPHSLAFPYADGHIYPIKLYLIYYILKYSKNTKLFMMQLLFSELRKGIMPAEFMQAINKYDTQFKFFDDDDIFNIGESLLLHYYSNSNGASSRCLNIPLSRNLKPSYIYLNEDVYSDHSEIAIERLMENSFHCTDFYKPPISDFVYAVPRIFRKHPYRDLSKIKNFMGTKDASFDIKPLIIMDNSAVTKYILLVNAILSWSDLFIGNDTVDFFNTYLSASDFDIFRYHITRSECSAVLDYMISQDFNNYAHIAIDYLKILNPSFTLDDVEDGLNIWSESNKISTVLSKTNLCYEILNLWRAFKTINFSYSNLGPYLSIMNYLRLSPVNWLEFIAHRINAIAIEVLPADDNCNYQIKVTLKSGQEVGVVTLTYKILTGAVPASDDYIMKFEGDAELFAENLQTLSALLPGTPNLNPSNNEVLINFYRNIDKFVFFVNSTNMQVYPFSLETGNFTDHLWRIPEELTLLGFNNSSIKVLIQGNIYGTDFFNLTGGDVLYLTPNVTSNNDKVVHSNRPTLDIEAVGKTNYFDI